jgi:biotin carboxyl carrier protein
MMPKVRSDLGQLPLVTPTSQIVGVQTVNNVLFDKPGESYSRITEQVKDLCFGLYGRTPRPINPDVQKKALKDYPRGEKPITCRPGDILEPELPKMEEEVKGLAKNIDDVLICALYPVTGKRFLEWKYGLKPIPEDTKGKSLEDVAREKDLIAKALKGELVEKPKKEVPPKPENTRAFDVYVDGEYFKVEVAGEPGPMPTNTVVRPVPVVAPAAPTPAPAPAAPKPTPAPKPAADTTGGQTVLAPIPGMIVEYKKKPGETIKAGEVLLILEAMKMYNNIESPCDGTVKDTPYKAGDTVGKDDVLCVIG